ncbi:MAG: hypothetical protein VYE40_11605 [Myxococcota bacterium]|nr:hypothetical protein [Myxococcota bacterium]
MTEKKNQERDEREDPFYDDLDDVEEEWEDIATDPEMMRRVLKAVEGIVPGILKRASIKGVGDALLSEDGLRSVLAEQKKLPKEAAGLLFSQADTMRREILRIVSREIRIFLENVDFGGEIAKILTSVSFEIKTEIRFIPNDQAVKPQIKNKVDAKRVKDGSKINLEDELSDPEDEDEDRASASTAPRDEGGEPEDDLEAGGMRKLRWGRRRKKPGNGEDASD